MNLKRNRRQELLINVEQDSDPNAFIPQKTRPNCVECCHFM